MADTHIKIKPVTPRVQYTANGSTTVFPYSFAIFDETDMVVYVDDDIITTGYTVSGAGETDGGNVTFDSAPEDGKKITLLRNVPIERMTDFQEGGTFRPKNINDEFDRQTAFMQQVQEKVDRTLILPPTTDIDPSQILGEVERIYSSIDNVDAVSDDIANVNAVAGDLANVDAVASDLANIDAVAADLATIDAVNANKTNIDAVAGNETNINAVAGNESDINTVAGIASDVSNVASNSSDVSNVATNMSDVNTCATNIAAIQDAPNQAQAAADSAALAYQYGNDKINQTHITNCITYIPQDIKLELNNGTLTLKAGSKVYVPNGIGVFDAVDITEDKTYTPYWLGDLKKVMLVFNPATNSFTGLNQSQFFSGATQPTVSDQYNVWYDTTNNKVKYTADTGSTWQDGWSFPICLFSNTSNVITSIDQIFNGFGYIGSTVFALPGVKGLIPNGRNEDGTLKNIDFEANNVILFTDSYKVDGSLCYALYEDNTISNYSLSGLKYNEQENMFYYNGHIVSDNIVVFANYEAQNYGKIVSFYPKTVFRAVDWNDKGTVAGWGMPGDRYIDLTLLASGNSYTAPANGWFSVGKTSSATGQYINIYIRSNGVSIGGYGLNSSASGQTSRISLPCVKGNEIQITYNMAGSSQYDYFRFVYAEGSESEAS